MQRTLYRMPNGIRIVRDMEWNEYIVKFPDGETYHTDDKQDAIDTARSIWAKFPQLREWADL